MLLRAAAKCLADCLHQHPIHECVRAAKHELSSWLLHCIKVVVLQGQVKSLHLRTGRNWIECLSIDSIAVRAIGEILQQDSQVRCIRIYVGLSWHRSGEIGHAVWSASANAEGGKAIR